MLDTNVVSALANPAKSRVVFEWINRTEADALWTTAITVYEIRFGVHRLADGRRKTNLASSVDFIFANYFRDRIANFDAIAAAQAAQIDSDLKKAGRPVEIRDLFIAGIALSRGATLVTANARHFVHTGVKLINPLDEAR